MFTAKALKRIQTEIKSLETEPIEGVLFHYDESDMSSIRVSIQGPVGTPYYCGFFEFDVKYPTNYPFSPPTVKFLTTDGGRFRFNPNLYKCGKVCLSIIGTWDGPQWSPIYTISYVICSIQSYILCDNPIRNEPFQEHASKRDSELFNIPIVHETIRVALLQNIRNKENPFHDKYIELFNQKFKKEALDILIKYTCYDRKNSSEGYSQNNITFNFSRIYEDILNE